jgi:hypothetical protein
LEWHLQKFFVKLKSIFEVWNCQFLLIKSWVASSLIFSK